MSKRLLAAVILFAITIATVNFANRLMVARAVSPPGADIREIVGTAVRPPYEIAAPHRTLFRELQLRLIPGAAAQTLEPCDCTETKSTCNNCPYGQCGECPDCWNGPCVIWKCQATNNTKKKCIEKMSTDPQCSTCRDDKNVNCQKPETCIGGICP